MQENSPDTMTIVLILVILVLALLHMIKNRFVEKDYYRMYNAISFAIGAIAVIAMIVVVLCERYVN